MIDSSIFVCDACGGSGNVTYTPSHKVVGSLQPIRGPSKQVSCRGCNGTGKLSLTVGEYNRRVQERMGFR